MSVEDEIRCEYCNHLNRTIPPSIFLQKYCSGCGADLDAQRFARLYESMKGKAEET